MKRRKRFPFLPVGIGAGLFLFAVVVGTLYLNGPIVLGKPADARAEDGKEAVETWLAENLDSGEWEEVRWWPERFVPASNARFNNYPPRDAMLARMKYRSETPEGGTKLFDSVFEISNGKAKPADNFLQPLAVELETWGD